jgi:hypothetical protein
MLAFNNLQLLFVKSLALDRHLIVFKRDTAICLKHRNVVFEACINYRTYIVKKGKAFFTNKGKDDLLN